MKKTKYIILKITYEPEDGTVTFKKTDSNFPIDDEVYDRLYDMLEEAGSKISRNLRKGIELKVTMEK